MDSIIVSVSELRSRLQDIRRSGAEYVRVSLMEADEDLPHASTCRPANHMTQTSGMTLMALMLFQTKAN